MKPRLHIPAIMIALAFGLGIIGPAHALDSPGRTLEVSVVAEGFETPWSIGFLPDGGTLVTEREGRLWHIPAQGRRQQVKGLPAIRSRC